MIKKLAFINVIVLVFVIGMNAAANILPFNNMTTGELSERVNVLFTPAGYVFSIWSVIYLALAVWAIRGLFTSHEGDRTAIGKIGWLFVWNGIFNVSWLILFHYEFYPWTMFPMAALLFSLILIYKKITESGRVTIWTKLPFSIYMGWVSVATIVNIGIFFNTVGLQDGFILSNIAWTVLIIPLGGIIAFIITYALGDILYSLVFAWAYIGIYLERLNESLWIAVIAITTAAFICLYIVVLIVQRQYILRLED